MSWLGHQIVNGAYCQILHWNLENKHEMFSYKLFSFTVYCVFVCC